MKLYYGLGIRKNMIKVNIEEIQYYSKFNLEGDLARADNYRSSKKSSFFKVSEKKKETSCCCCGSCIV